MQSKNIAAIKKIKVITDGWNRPKAVKAPIRNLPAARKLPFDQVSERGTRSGVTSYFSSGFGPWKTDDQTELSGRAVFAIMTAIKKREATA